MSTSAQEYLDGSNNSDDVWSEYRVTSALFVDLVGSVSLLDEIGADRYRFALRQFHSIILGAVRAYDGIAHQFLGDGAMCLFNQEAFGESGAVRAVEAALEIQRVVREISKGDLNNALVRIGIATGRVLFANDQEDQVVGGPVNLASRLQGVAPIGEILICKKTRDAVTRHIETGDSSSYDLKGYAAPIEAWIAEGARAVPARRAGSKLVIGREREQQKLVDKLRFVKKGQGNAELVLGAAGFGKSCLIDALLSGPEVSNCAILSLQCVREQKSTNFHPLRSYVEWVADARPNDDEQDRIAKIRQVLESVWGLSSDEIDQFLFVINVLPKNESNEDPVLLRKWFFDVIMDHFKEMAAGFDALVLVVEDVHWMDPSSIAFFKELLAEIDELPIFAVLSQRELDGDMRVFDLDHEHTTKVRALGTENSGALAAFIIGDAELSLEKLDWVTKKAQGNPLFIEAYGDMIRTRESNPRARDQVPLDFLGVIEERLASLPQSVRRFIQIASVIGRRFDPDLVKLLMDKDAELPPNTVSSLVEIHILNKPNSGVDLLFSHELIRDAIYFNLGETVRHRLHAWLADLLMDLSETRSVNLQMLAHHCEKSRQFEKAIDTLQQAAQAAVQAGATQEALSFVEKALGLLEEVDQKAEIEMALRALEGPIRMMASGPGSPDFGLAMRRSVQLMHQHRPSSERTHIFYNVGLHHWANAELDEASEIAETIANGPNIEGSDAKELACNTLFGLVAWHQGRNLEAKDLLQNTLSTYNSQKHLELYLLFLKDFGVFANFYSALTYSVLGDHDAAAHFAQTAENLSMALDFPHERGFAGLAQIWAAVFRGDFDAVLHHCDHTQQMSATYNFPEFVAMAQIAEGWVRSHHTTTRDAAIVAMQNGLSGWKETQFSCWQGLFGVLLAKGLIRTGAHDEARDVANYYLNTIQETGEKQWLSPLHRVRASTYTKNEETMHAEADITKARTIARLQKSNLWNRFLEEQ